MLGLGNIETLSSPYISFVLEVSRLESSLFSSCDLNLLKNMNIAPRAYDIEYDFKLRRKLSELAAITPYISVVT
jgi:hypothetical protein